MQREYTAWDNSDRKDCYDKCGNLQETHVDRYDYSGRYTHTDVYNMYGALVRSYVK